MKLALDDECANRAQQDGDYDWGRGGILYPDRRWNDPFTRLNRLANGSELDFVLCEFFCHLKLEFLASALNYSPSQAAC